MQDPISLSVANGSESEDSLSSPDEREPEGQLDTTVLVVETPETTTKVIITATSTVRPEEIASFEYDDSDNEDYGWKARGPDSRKVAGHAPTPHRVRDQPDKDKDKGNDARAKASTKANAPNPKDEVSNVSKASKTAAKGKIRPL